MKTLLTIALMVVFAGVLPGQSYKDTIPKKFPCHTDLAKAKAEGKAKGKPVFVFVGTNCDNHPKLAAQLREMGVLCHQETLNGVNDKRVAIILQGGGEGYTLESKISDQTPAKLMKIYAETLPPPVNAPRAGIAEEVRLVPAPQQLTYGSGCRGYQAGGCYGQQAGGCKGFTAGFGTASTYTVGSGCVGGGSDLNRAGFTVAVTAPPAANYRQSLPAVTFGGVAPVGRGAPAVAYGRTETFAAGNVPYGASLTNGTYATSTGDPPGPGVFGVPGAGWPFDGPFRRMGRKATGYDPGPARKTVRAGF